MLAKIRVLFEEEKRRVEFSWVCPFKIILMYTIIGSVSSDKIDVHELKNFEDINENIAMIRSFQVTAVPSIPSIWRNSCNPRAVPTVQSVAYVSTTMI